jgi:hypothetical protein
LTSELNYRGKTSISRELLVFPSVRKSEIRPLKIHSSPLGQELICMGARKSMQKLLGKVLQAKMFLEVRWTALISIKKVMFQHN